MPVSGQCTAVEWLNANAYGGYAWIKGHLLNDNLGGEGISENLTPMTDTANMRYKAFESSIKRAIDECYRQGQFSYGSRWYGVRVAIDVVGQQWPHAPHAAGQAVATHVADRRGLHREGRGAAAPRRHRAARVGAAARDRQLRLRRLSGARQAPSRGARARRRRCSS